MTFIMFCRPLVFGKRITRKRICIAEVMTTINVKIELTINDWIMTFWSSRRKIFQSVIKEAASIAVNGLFLFLSLSITNIYYWQSYQCCCQRYRRKIVIVPVQFGWTAEMKHWKSTHQMKRHPPNAQAQQGRVELGPVWEGEVTLS